MLEKGGAGDTEREEDQAGEEVEEEVLGGGTALAGLDTPHAGADHQDHQAGQAGQDGRHGDAVCVLHQDGEDDDRQHVDHGPESDGESGDGDDGDPDGEDGGEGIAPAEERDADQADAVDLLGTGVVETAGDEVRGEDDTLGVVTPVGGQHDGGEHGEVGGCEEEAGDQEVVVRHGLAGVVTGEASVPGEAGAGGEEDVGGEVGVAVTVPAIEGLVANTNSSLVTQ